MNRRNEGEASGRYSPRGGENTRTLVAEANGEPRDARPTMKLEFKPRQAEPGSGGGGEGGGGRRRGGGRRMTVGR